VKLQGHGLGIDLIDGWEARVFRRARSVGADDTQPIVHLANFPLPEVRGDFGGGVVEHLRSGDVFVVLFDYGPDAVDQPLFARHGMPQLTPSHFRSANLQRAIPGQVGAQRFFQHHGRAFGLYVVAGDAATARRLVGEVNHVVTNIAVTPPGTRATEDTPMTDAP
jgi:hypothetical protein